MKAAVKRSLQGFGILAALLLIVGLIAPHLSGEWLRPRIKAALESGLARKVELGKVTFDLFTGPGVSVDTVVIHENPAIGIEPIAYVGTLSAVPRLASLFSGRLEFSSIRLDDASINLSKTGAPSEEGHWNFEPLLAPSVIRSIPEVHVRSSRFNFKFGDTKSVFYLTDTDLDITPPSGGANRWVLDLTGQPARTDRPAHGFGNLIAHGRWIPANGGSLDLNMRLEKSAIEEMAELIQGYDVGVHGLVSASMHMTGALDNIKLEGRMALDGVHRWDLLPPPHAQSWPFKLTGRLDLPGQKLELDSSTAGGETLPLSVRLRCSNYLSQPRWGAALSWNRFPVEPLVELARHMGAALPAKLVMTGTLDGVLGYSPQSGAQGEVDFHDASISMPDAPPIQSAQARLIVDGGHARLEPAVVHTAPNEQAEVTGDYDWREPSLNLTIATDEMRVESLRAQSALASIRWLEQMSSGVWKGQLQYRFHGGTDALARNEWAGKMELRNARFPLPGLAEPVEVKSAVAHLDGASLRLEDIHAQAGKIALQAEYQYQPRAVRPHHLRVSIPEADAVEVERLFMPCLHHERGLLASALSLGRASLPEWLASQHVDAALQVDLLHLAGQDASGIRAHLLWDGAKAEFDDIRAKVNGGQATGKLSVSLRGNRPAYQLAAHATGIEWKSGSVDADAALEASGVGMELLAHLHCTGAFTAHGLEMDGLPDLESVSGAYDLVWGQTGPRLRFPELQLVSNGETYSGQGASQPDGRLLIQLSSGSKEMHMTGTLAELSLEKPESR